MTLAVYNPATNTVKVDSLLSWDDGSTQMADKVTYHGDFSYTFTGSLQGGVLMTKAIRLLMDSTDSVPHLLLTHEEAESLRDCDGFVRRARDGATASYYYVCVHGPFLVVSPCASGHGPVLAIGSGSSMFRAFLQSGRSVDDAFDDAIRHCATCGGFSHEF